MGPHVTSVSERFGHVLLVEKQEMMFALAAKPAQASYSLLVCLKRGQAMWWCVVVESTGSYSLLVCLKKGQGMWWCVVVESAGVAQLDWPTKAET